MSDPEPKTPQPGPADCPAATPPRLDPAAFERYEGFRETTLAYFTDPESNASLRSFGELHYTLVLEYWHHWPMGPEGAFRHLARAGVADLRHLQGFFAFLAHEPEASELTPEEERLAALCEGLAVRVQEVADTLERELDA